MKRLIVIRLLCLALTLPGCTVYMNKATPRDAAQGDVWIHDSMAAARR